MIKHMASERSLGAPQLSRRGVLSGAAGFAAATVLGGTPAARAQGPTVPGRGPAAEPTSEPTEAQIAAALP
ncbi:MAG: hypothetical protein JXB36_08630, partial [Gammaproteobacteria bacterium]|nr:hypothetical protein [Gammaproteobacteria bacterium]